MRMKRAMQCADGTRSSAVTGPAEAVEASGRDTRRVDPGKRVRDEVRARQPMGAFDARAIRELTQAVPLDPTNLRRTIRRNELRQLVPLADSTIYELERRGEFPQRFFLTARCVVWDLAEVEEWLRRRRQPGGEQVKKAPTPDFRQRKRGPVKQISSKGRCAPALFA